MMFAYHFFYPDKMIPTIELVSALVKGRDLRKSHMCMKVGTVGRQVFIFLFGIGDAGVEIKDTHLR